jgi:hypothetical protein
MSCKKPSKPAWDNSIKTSSRSSATVEAAAGAGAGAAGGGGVEAGGGDERKENSTTLEKCENLKECDPPPPPHPPTAPHVPSPLIQKRSSKKQDKQKLLHQDNNRLTWRGISQGAQNTPGDDDDDDALLADKRRTSSVVPSHHLHQHLQFTTDHRTSQDSSSFSQEQGACTHPSFGQEHVNPWIDCRDPRPTNPWDSGDVVVDTVDHCTPVKCVDDAVKKKMKKQAQEGVQKMGTTSDETWSSSCSSSVDCDDQQEVIKTQQQGSGRLLKMMGTEKIKHQHHHHHHHQKQPSSSSSETSCWRQNCRATGEDELHQETYQDPLQDHHRPWQDPFPNCDTETLLHQQDDYDGMEKQQHVTAAASLGAERSRLRGGREEDDGGIGLQENGPVWIVKAQRYPLRKRETREQQLLRRRGSSVFASMRNTSFLDDAEEHTISSFFRQPLKLQQKKKKKKKRAPSPPAPKRKPRFCTGMNRGKGEDDDDDEQQQQLQQQRQRGATNKSKKKLSSVLPLLFLSTDETNGLWTRRSSCCKEEDCSGSHRRDCCHLRSCLDPPGPQSVVAAAHHHQRWDEGTGHKKAVVVATPPPPQKCQEEQQGTAYYSSSKTPSMLSTARIIAKLEASSATKKAPFLSKHAQEDPRNPSSLFSSPASSPTSSLLSLLSSSHHRRGLSGLRIGFCFGRRFEQRLLTQRKHGVYSRHKRKRKPRVARHMLQIRNSMVCILKH